MWNRKITIDGGMGTELVRCGATEVFLDEKLKFFLKFAAQNYEFLG